MPKIRTLVVDDSAVVRQLLTSVLSEDSRFEVVGRVPNGALALAKVPQVNPDIVILDLEMPEMDGHSVIRALRKTHPKLPIIVFSNLSVPGAEATLTALSLGATDYLAKPEKTGGVEATRDWIHRELIPKLIALSGQSVLQLSSEIRAVIPPKLRDSSSRPAAASRVDILAIGVSTGGPNALAELVPALSANFPVPVVIVQHMPAFFTKLLADRLNATSQIPVQEARDGDEIVPGSAWIAPGTFHMTLKRENKKIIVRLNQDAPENSCRPSVDVLFRSVVDIYDANTLAVVLTGMGSDGLRGSQLVRERGGTVLAQDEASSVVWGMPGYVAKAGIADEVLPLKNIAPTIMRILTRGRTMLAS